MANWYFWNENDEKIGPVRGRVLISLALHGTIAPHTKVEDSEGRIVFAKYVKGLTFSKIRQETEDTAEDLEGSEDSLWIREDRDQFEEQMQISKESIVPPVAVYPLTIPIVADDNPSKKNLPQVKSFEQYEQESDEFFNDLVQKVKRNIGALLIVFCFILIGFVIWMLWWWLGMVGHSSILDNQMDVVEPHFVVEVEENKIPAPKSDVPGDFPEEEKPFKGEGESNVVSTNPDLWDEVPEYINLEKALTESGFVGDVSPSLKLFIQYGNALLKDELELEENNYANLDVFGKNEDRGAKIIAVQAKIDKEKQKIALTQFFCDYSYKVYRESIQIQQGDEQASCIVDIDTGFSTEKLIKVSSHIPDLGSSTYQVFNGTIMPQNNTFRLKIQGEYEHIKELVRNSTNYQARIYFVGLHYSLSRVSRRAGGREVDTKVSRAMIEFVKIE